MDFQFAVFAKSFKFSQCPWSSILNSSEVHSFHAAAPGMIDRSITGLPNAQRVGLRTQRIKFRNGVVKILLNSHSVSLQPERILRGTRTSCYFLAPEVGDHQASEDVLPINFFFEAAEIECSRTISVTRDTGGQGTTT